MKNTEDIIEEDVIDNDNGTDINDGETQMMELI